MLGGRAVAADEQLQGPIASVAVASVPVQHGHVRILRRVPHQLRLADYIHTQCSQIAIAVGVQGSAQVPA